DEWAATIAWVDGRVGLQIVLVNRPLRIKAATALGTDNAGRHGTGQTERSSDGENAVADLHGIAIAKLEIRKRHLGINANDGQIVLPIALDICRGKLGAVLQSDPDLTRAVHDMIVRQDDAFRVDYQPRTKALTGQKVF